MSTEVYLMGNSSMHGHRRGVGSKLNRPPFLTQEGTPHDVEYECQDDGDKDGKYNPNKSTMTKKDMEAMGMSVRETARLCTRHNRAGFPVRALNCLTWNFRLFQDHRRSASDLGC